MAETATEHNRDLQTELSAPNAFVSYAHENWDSAVALTEELKLRGFGVFRDVEGMREGRRMEHEMAEGIDRADVVTPYLSPESLDSEPVVEKEFKPALRKGTRQGKPVVMPIVSRLGATHEEVTENTWSVLQHDFTSTWSGGIRKTGTEPMEPVEAAGYAKKALAAVLPRGEGPGDGEWQLHIATQGGPDHADGLSIDATSFLGGGTKKSGTPADWRRVLVGLRDLEEVLRAHGGRRGICLTGTAHFTAAVTAGLTFRSTARWRLSVVTDDGTCQPQCQWTTHEGLDIHSEPGTPGSTFTTAEVNLLGVPMDKAVDSVLADVGRPAHRLRIERADATGRIPCAQLAAMAAATAAAIKQASRENGADCVHLFVAAPWSFCVFLGAELNATAASMQLYEYADGAYIPSLELESR